MNELEKALQGDNEELSSYLGEVSCDEFRAQILELKRKNSDKAAIKAAIEALQKLV